MSLDIKLTLTDEERLAIKIASEGVKFGLDGFEKIVLSESIRIKNAWRNGSIVITEEW